MGGMNAFRDLRFAFRLLVRNPAFALAAMTVMALGIGATTAVFTVVRGVLLRPHHGPRRGPIVADREAADQHNLISRLNNLGAHQRGIYMIDHFFE